jgi:hypothetical protein
MTCWRHVRDWHRAGVFKQAFRGLLDQRNAQGKADWSGGVVDSGSVLAVFGGRRPARIRRTGAKRDKTSHSDGWVGLRALSSLGHRHHPLCTLLVVISKQVFRERTGQAVYYPAYGKIGITSCCRSAG